MRIVAWTLLISVLVASCSAAESEPATAVEDAQAPLPSTEVFGDPVDALGPGWEPGQVLIGQIDIGGTAVDYVVLTPAGFTPGDGAPVLLAMPPGGQDLSLTERVVAGNYAAEALARGWVVVSPAAPDGVRYFDGSEALVPGLLAWIDQWVAPEGERVHLAGVSNGGLSAFRLAADQPDAYHSIVVFPGFPRNADDRAALSELVDIPIRLFVGETDTAWVEPMEETARTLTELDGDVELEIFAGEGHIIGSLSDGVRIFDELDAARP